MYSATKVNQFEMKDTCFQFVINVSGQGNNVKIKYNWKMNIISFTLNQCSSEAVVHRCPLKKRFLKFCNIHRKRPVLESVCNKVADL